jgi:hypothetical protein
MKTTLNLLREESEKFFRDIYQGLIKANMYTISKKLEIITDYLFKSCQQTTEYMKERLCQRKYVNKTTQSVYNIGLDRVASQPTKSILSFNTHKKGPNKYGPEMDIRQTFMGFFCQGHQKEITNAK